jgi:uncharacterized membrane protein
MAELEQEHRLACEKAALEANISSAEAERQAIRRGHYLGAAISGFCILAAVCSVYLGANWAVSVALVGVPVMSTVRALFVRNGHD